MTTIEQLAITLTGAGLFLGWFNGSSRVTLALNAAGFGLLLVYGVVTRMIGAQ